MFSAVYYLWATEQLQKDWIYSPEHSELAPNIYAKDAIWAAVELITDKGNASWVIRHWGEKYLEQENLFYRMLLISGLTSFYNLTGDETYQDILAKQVTTLASELDSSPYGLLDDYPGESYPVDILPAISSISRGAEILDLDMQGFIDRAKRGFANERLDPKTELPAYFTDSKSGIGYGPARGVGMSYMLIWATEIWPEVAKSWYTKYQNYFWEERKLISGIREYPANANAPNWTLDVDAGPVIAGFGTAASAFGIAAARVNGHFEHAYPLSVQALATSWPLPNGSLLTPKLLSNLSDAPFIGETALLFIFTRQPLAENAIHPETLWPTPFVFILLSIYLIIGLILTRGAYQLFRRISRQIVITKNATNTQWFLWLGLATSLFFSLTLKFNFVAFIFALLMLLLPRLPRRNN